MADLDNRLIEAQKTRIAEQNNYWEALKQRLEKIEITYGISKTDIANGLGVSRQSLYNFINKPYRGIRLDRSSIVGLYDYIRCEASDSLKSDPELRTKRVNLTDEELSLWLSEAGYAGVGAEKLSIVQDPTRTSDHQIKRVALRLKSKWVPDDATKNYLVNGFLDQILDTSRLDNAYYAESIPYVKRDEIKRLQSREKKKKNVLKISEELLYDVADDSKIQKKYESVLERLSQEGKDSFVRAELFELYQSILEHHYIDQSSTVKLRTLDCRFRTLTFSLFDHLFYKIKIQRNNPYLDEKIKTCSEYAEREIRGLPTEGIDLSSFDKRDETVNTLISTDPILRAIIKCTLRLAEGKTSEIIQEEFSPFSIEFSSNATHIENMLLALKYGFCYPLDVASFFMRATGRTEKSLARVSMTLSETDPEDRGTEQTNKGEYAGWWVTMDTLTGIQKATTDAFSRWLNDQPFPQEMHYVDRYFLFCQELAEIKARLAQARQALYEHTPALKTQQDQSSLKKFIEENILEKKEKIESSTKLGETREEEAFSIHWQKLESIGQLAEILKARVSLIDIGSPEHGDALENLERLIDDLDGDSNPFSHVIRLYATAYEMMYKLVTGNQEFIVGKQWLSLPRYSVKGAVRHAHDYIGARKGVVTVDVYTSMSDVYGTVGVIGFYCNDSFNQLEDALENLLKAAHFSLKINYKNRAVQWLAYASRICTRQGKLDEAIQILSLIRGIADNAVIEEIEAQRTDSSYAPSKENISDSLFDFWERGNWVDVARLLAHGEILLHRQKEQSQQAFLFFLRALKIAQDLRFSRIIPDCLYNMSRAAQNWVKEAEDKSDFASLKEAQNRVEEVFPSFPGSVNESIPAEHELNKLMSTYRAGRSRLSSLDETSADGQIEYLKSFKDIYTELAEEALNVAAQYWDDWAMGGAASHPLAQTIRTGKFLSFLD